MKVEVYCFMFDVGYVDFKRLFQAFVNNVLLILMNFLFRYQLL